MTKNKALHYKGNRVKYRKEKNIKKNKIKLQIPDKDLVKEQLDDMHYLPKQNKNDILTFKHNRHNVSKKRSKTDNKFNYKNLPSIDELEEARKQILALFKDARRQVNVLPFKKTSIT
jgi:hypothetical protein